MCYLSDVTLLVDNYVTYVKYPFIASSSLLFALLLRSTKDKWRQMSNIAEIVSFCQKRRRSYLKAIVLKQNGSILAVVHRPLIDATRFDSKSFDLEIFGVEFPDENVKNTWIETNLISRRKHIWFRPVGGKTDLMLKANILYRPRFFCFKKNLNIDLISRGFGSVRALPPSLLDDKCAVDLHLALKAAEISAQTKNIGIWKKPRGLALKSFITSFFSRRHFSTKMDISVSGLESKLNTSELLTPTHVEVQDTSGGCGASFFALVVSDKFRDLKLLQRHRLVNQTLADELKEIHAFQMKTVTTEEYEKLKSK